MTRRALGAALAVAALSLVCAPPAPAALSDGVVPVLTPADGVRFVVVRGGAMQVRFGPSARGLYRRALAGRDVQVECTRTRRGGPVGLFPAERSSSTTVRAPRRPGRLTASLGDVAGADLCTLATRDEEGGVGCEDGWCPVAIAALTPAGRARVEELRRALDLTLALFAVVLATEDAFAWPSPTELVRRMDGARAGGPDDQRADWTVLASPDAAPAVPGPVGLFSDARTLVLSAVTAAGRPLFVRFDGEVFSTNVPELAGGGG